MDQRAQGETSNLVATVIGEASREEAGCQGFRVRLWSCCSVSFGVSLSIDSLGGFYFYFLKSGEFLSSGWPEIIVDLNSLE